MTTTTILDHTTVVANGVTPIPFTFQAITEDEVGVLRNGIEQVGGFTVDLNGDGTGTVTPGASWGTNVVIVFSKPTYQQPADFTRFGAFYPDQFNYPLDRLARVLLVLRSSALRSIKAPLGDPDLADLPPAAYRADKVMAFDADGDPYTPNVSAANLETLAGIAAEIVTAALVIAPHIAAVLDAVNQATAAANSATAAANSAASIVNLLAVNPAAAAAAGSTKAILQAVINNGDLDALGILRA